MLTVFDGEVRPLEEGGQPHHSVHEWQQEDIDAINAALAARRPLLLSGDPGVGKTQLAKAAAIELGFAYVHQVVDTNTEARELRWTQDLVQRLSDAQLAGGQGSGSGGAREPIDYVEPGPLWWAFSWGTARKQVAKRNQCEIQDAPTPPQPDTKRCDPANGMVLLIDEIDKAEPELPNSLLEALGAREFQVPWRNAAVKADVWPLVIVTTNNDRPLPDAFVRRCLFHEMALPELSKLEDFLFERGKLQSTGAPETLLKHIAQMVVKDRSFAIENELRPYPGQAEFFDLLRAATELEADENMLRRIAPFFLKKHPADRYS
ncbi:MAG: AAA family ATPase [Pelagibaca sp.]|nr:AAA family ATPase [Pelagibaca sp.]